MREGERERRIEGERGWGCVMWNSKEQSIMGGVAMERERTCVKEEILYVGCCSCSQHQVAHGGLFKDDDVTLDDIRAYDRNRQPPEEGVQMCLLFCVTL